MSQLNRNFKAVRLSSFPAPKGDSVLEIPSNASVIEAARLLESRDVLSAPVFDETAPRVRLLHSNLTHRTALGAKST